MPELTESLVVRILGDSSHLEQELERLGATIEGLSRQAELAGSLGEKLSRSLGGIRTSTSALEGLERAATSVLAVLGRLNGATIVLNVAPALAALGRLSAGIASVAAQLQALSAMQVLAAPAAIPLPAGGGRVPVPGFAHGGLVTGPLGLDRVPAMLSAGEFVIRRETVQQVGLQALRDLNVRGTVASPAIAAGRSDVVNQFGEISIHVSQPGDVGALLQDLAWQGHRLRNRRG